MEWQQAQKQLGSGFISSDLAATRLVTSTSCEEHGADKPARYLKFTGE
jgi:hypothetical protein